MSTEFDEGYAEHLSDLAKKLGGKVEVVGSVWTLVHSETGRVVHTSKSPRSMAGWLSAQKDSGQSIQAPPPRRGRKPGAAKKSARKAAMKRTGE